MTYFPGSSVFPETHGPQSVCFPSLAPATFPGNTIDTIRSLLWSSYKSSSYKWLSQGVARFENNFNIVSVRYTCELSRDNSYIYVRYRKRTEWLHLLRKKNNSL